MSWRRGWRWWLATMLAAMLAARVVVGAESGDYRYTSDGAAVTITAYLGSGGVAAIPATIGGLPVTAIGISAFSGARSVTGVTIPESVTSIWNYAFQNCTNLASVAIPARVTLLASGAFWMCRGLTNVTIGAAVPVIEMNTFEGCAKLTQVAIPDRVWRIRDDAFKDCARLARVTLGSGVTSIGTTAFRNCTALADYVVSAANPVYSSVGGLLCDKAGTGLLECPRGRTGDVAVPAAVTNVGDRAFTDCAKISSVSIPAGVLATLWPSTFRGCSNLTAIAVDPANTQFSSLEGILYDKSRSTLLVCPAAKAGGVHGLPATLNRIVGQSFQDCGRVTGVTIPSGVTVIAVGAFQRCGALTNIAIPSTVRWLEASAFMGCSNLTSATIPVGVALVERSLFEGCSRLAAVSIPSTVTEIRQTAFRGCASLEQVTIPSSVTTIGIMAFADCRRLAGVVIPAGVTIIENGTFSGCSALASVALPDGLDVLSSEAFEGCTSLRQVTIPGTVGFFGDEAFRDCTALTDVTLADGVLMIGGWAFLGCTQLERVQMGPGLLDIGYNAFDGCGRLTGIAIPSTVTRIRGAAFIRCTNLTSVAVSGGKVEDYAFFGCAGLTNVTLGSGVTLVGERAFGACARLPAIGMHPANATYRSVDGILYDAAQRELIQCPGGKVGGVHTIPGTVTNIAMSAFDNCPGITAITLPAGLLAIGDSAFVSCFGLTTVRIPASVRWLGQEAFYACSNVRGFYFEGNAPMLEYGSAFRSCDFATAYYYAGTTGWQSGLVSGFGGLPTVMITPAVPLGTALGSPALTWSTGGAQAWFSEATISADGTGAAQSGPVGNGQQSWVEAVVAGATSIGFWWKASSETNDVLTFALDGVPQAQISGPIDWQWDGFYVPTGVHTVRWTYAKNASVTVDDDAAWVDGVATGLFGAGYPLGNGWVWSEWFGSVATGRAPWMYHAQHGWLYAFGTDPQGVVFWDSAMNACWWSAESTYPYLYRFSDGSWLWCQEGSARPRWLLNLRTGRWERW